jgi:CheY-like chemotaxis protein
MNTDGFDSVDSLHGVLVYLLAEDAEARGISASILRYCGALVREMASPEEAVTAMRTVRPQVLVIALRAPQRPLLDLARRDCAFFPSREARFL